MTKELKRITFDEFASNLALFFKQVIDDHETVVVENDEGERIVVQPLPTPTSERILTEDDYLAFRSAFGGWADVDTDSLKKAIYESRKLSRPPVNL
ncbi:MAG: hypothetical protein IT328_05590 [Caldilineaceae bacterium]|nr:hypothetical protein [Caldilineaceae bacterium]